MMLLMTEEQMFMVIWEYDTQLISHTCMHGSKPCGHQTSCIKGKKPD